jgi:spore photoproduct lyase
MLSPMKTAAEYDAKLARLESGTLLPVLEPQTREFVRDLARTYRFTFQELRAVVQAGRDLEMWGEGSIESWWSRAEKSISTNGRERKKALLRLLEGGLREVAAAEKAYPPVKGNGFPRRRVKLEERESPNAVFGRCPAYSEHTVCCGLYTLDAVRGCPFGCSYCTIQTFYGETAELESDLARKLGEIELEPDRLYHIGTGQSSDSLVWGNRGGNLESLLDFAAGHPNVVLELKTKSDNIGYLVEREIPQNVVCSWTLNTETIIRNEEHGTASLAQRLGAARALADHGCRVGFHFHPMVYYQGWREEYPGVAQQLLARFSPDEVAFLSMGSVTFIRPVVQEIRKRGGSTKILQMEMVPDHHGKLTYPDEVKRELFRSLYDALGPWHGRVFFYLCMEAAAIWESVLGWSFPTNEVFEQAFAEHCLNSAGTERPVSGRVPAPSSG